MNINHILDPHITNSYLRYESCFISIILLGLHIGYVVDSDTMLNFFLTDPKDAQTQIFANNFMIYQTSLLFISFIGTFGCFYNHTATTKSIILSIIISIISLNLMILMIWMRYDIFLVEMLIISATINFAAIILLIPS